MPFRSLYIPSLQIAYAFHPKDVRLKNGLPLHHLADGCSTSLVWKGLLNTGYRSIPSELRRAAR